MLRFEYPRKLLTMVRDMLIKLRLFLFMQTRYQTICPEKELGIYANDNYTRAPAVVGCNSS